MAIKSLSWSDLIVWNGSQDNAFEELCCQLAHGEPGYAPTGDRYIRNGTPDAGVECTWTLQGGDVHGWQAKFFRARFDNSQVAQLDESFQSAVSAYANLRRYTVCIPMNLPNARKANQLSARQRWENCRKKWEQQTAGRIEIVLWDETALLERLAPTSRTGLRALWFGGLHLSLEWFREHGLAALANLGGRYRPAFDVTAADRSVFEGLSLSAKFRERIQRCCTEVTETARDWIGSSNTKVSALAKEATALSEYIERWSHDGSIQFDAEDVARRANQLSGTAEALILEGCQLYGPLTSLSRLSASTAFKAAVARCLFLTGEAGSGKTHFLAWGLDNQLRRGKGAIFVQGRSFRVVPLAETSGLLGLPDFGSDALLGALDAHGERTGERILILIDALNETPSPTIWQDQISGLLLTLRRFPHVSVAVAIRSTYLDVVLPEKITPQTHPFLEHRGFEDVHPIDLIPLFLAYGLQPPAFPMPTMEFRNPLVLHLLCESARSAGDRRVPQFESLTKVLEYYLSAVNRTLSQQECLGFHVGLDLVTEAAMALAAEMTTHGRRWLELKQANKIVTSVFQQRAGKPHLAFQELIRENVLSEDRYTTGQSPVPGVSFTFERLGEYLIARAELAVGQDLARLKQRWGSSKDRGVREMLSLLLAQEYRIEPANSFDIDHDEAGRLSVQHIVWRDPATFGPEFTRYLESRLQDGTTFAEFAIPMLVAIATDPRHPYNALWLDSLLSKWSMPVRDARWSVPLSMGMVNDLSAILRRFVSDGWRQTSIPPTVQTFIGFVCGYQDLGAILPEQRSLASALLCWMLALPDLTYIAWTSKAIGRLWKVDFTLAQAALLRHSDTDDPILLSRLLFCCEALLVSSRESVESENVRETLRKAKSCESLYGPLRNLFSRLAGRELELSGDQWSRAIVNVPAQPPVRLVKRVGGDEVIRDITNGPFAEHHLRPAAATLAEAIGQTTAIESVRTELEAYVQQRTLKLLAAGRRYSEDQRQWVQHVSSKYQSLSLGEAVTVVLKRRGQPLADSALWTDVVPPLPSLEEDLASNIKVPFDPDGAP